MSPSDVTTKGALMQSWSCVRMRVAPVWRPLADAAGRHVGVAPPYRF